MTFSRALTISLMTIFAFSMSSLKTYAAPTIASVSGTVSQGQTLTVSGSGFGTKSPVAPLIWADFATNINPSTLGQKTSWDSVENLVFSSSLPAGAGTTKGVVGTWNSTLSQRAFDFYINKSANYTRTYSYSKTYMTNTSSGNMKFWRLWPSTLYNDFVASTSNGGICLNEVDTSNPSRYQGVSFSPNTWYTHEFMWQYSGGTGLPSNGGASGIWDYKQNGVTKQHLENSNNDGGYGNTQNQLVIGPFTDSADLLPDGSMVYMTSIYVDDNYAHVIIGDQSTLAASTHREIQIPKTQWIDGQLQVQVNQGSFASGSTAYLYVVDASGNVSSGNKITFGGSTPSGPTAPNNLKVTVQ